MQYHFRKKHLEAFFWIAAIGALALTNPESSGHFSLCPLKNAGFDFCPGCGLGHAISWLFRGELAVSFKSHPLGIPAVAILLMRSFRLLKNDITTQNIPKWKGFTD
ncbi:MAG: DUF2752 domain-containing protein [Marinilabiliaceae bacterium]